MFNPSEKIKDSRRQGNLKGGMVLMGAQLYKYKKQFEPDFNLKEFILETLYGLLYIAFSPRLQIAWFASNSFMLFIFMVFAAIMFCL